MLVDLWMPLTNLLIYFYGMMKRRRNSGKVNGTLAESDRDGWSERRFFGLKIDAFGTHCDDFF
jgi:hypothetical protein